MDDTVTAKPSSRESSTVAEIWRLVWQLEPTAVYEYLSALEGSLKASPSVAVAAALAYLNDDNYQMAARAIDAANTKEMMGISDWHNDELIASLALVSGITDAHRKFEYSRLIQLVKEVEGIYVMQGWSILTDFEARGKETGDFSPHAENPGLKEAQQIQNKPTGLVDHATMSDSREDEKFWLEYLLLTAQYMLTSMGWGSWKNFSATYAPRHKRILEILSAQGSTDHATILTFAIDAKAMLGGVAAAALYYNNLLDSYKDTDTVPKFSTMVRLASLQAAENLDSAQMTLATALALVEGRNIPAGMMICEYHQVRLISRQTQSPSACLEQMISLADRFLVAGNHKFHYLAINEAISIAVNDSTLLGQLSLFLNRIIPQLQEREDEFCVMRLEILRAYDSAKHSVSAEQARIWLEDLLQKRPGTLTPVQQADVYDALYVCYTTSNDRTKASKYAEKHFELLRKIDGSSASQLSTGRHCLALSRLAVLQDFNEHQRSRLDDEDEEDQIWEYRKRHKALAMTEIAELGQWIDIDKENRVMNLVQDKTTTLETLKTFMRTHFPEENIEPAKLEDSDLLAFLERGSEIDLGHLLKLARTGRGLDGIRLANAQLKRALNAPNTPARRLSDAYYTCALSYDVLGRFDKVNRPTTTTAMDEHLAFQARYLREHRDICQAIGDHHSLIRTALPFQATMLKLITRYPDQRLKLIEEEEQYLMSTERAAEIYRRSVLQSHSLASLLQMQRAISSGLTQVFYKAAVEFYLQQKDAPTMWRWAQKGRARSLTSIIMKHPTSDDRLAAAFEKVQDQGLLAADTAALTPDRHQGSALEQLQHSGKSLEQRHLFDVPSLQTLLLEGPLEDTGFGFDASRAIFDQVKDCIPAGTNVVLVNWIVDMSGRFCLMAMDCENQQVHARPSLRLRDVDIRHWIEQYLVFPKDATKPLESDRPLRELIPLVEGLENFSNPGDLLVLSPPADLSSVPLHAVPLLLGGPTLIERNPVIYVSSFDLYAECLRRVKLTRLQLVQPLSDAIFTACFEDQLEEREHIFEQMERMAHEFGARKRTGHELTAHNFREALIGGPWVHYHGHAFFDAAEPLNSSFVLSNGDALGEISHSHDGHTSDQENQTISCLPASSNISIPDIFTMDMTKHHPFVCCVACDSGTQEVRAIDEPVGLATALFCAGATSVLGTLWLTESSVGRAFTTAFYAALARQTNTQSGSEEGSGRRPNWRGVFNLADALREAVLFLKEKNNKPISWAGFVLHGAGFYGGDAS